MRPTRILLLGLMGSGKTVVGSALADLLGRPWLDNDALVTADVGLAKDALVRRGGEEALREAEATVVELLLAREGPYVAGLPAGVVLDPACRDALTNAGGDVVLVWLRASPSTLTSRLGVDPQGRPWLGLDLEHSVREMASTREPWFAELADITVDVDDGTPREIAERIIAALDLA